MKDCWSGLRAHHDRTRSRSIHSLFDTHNRFENFHAECDGMLLDWSKTNIDETTVSRLLDLFDKAQVAEKRDAMFSGKKINETEDRAVLHTALRNLSGPPIKIEGKDIMPALRETHQRMADFAGALRDGSVSASDGAAFRDVVNIGIGGSDLGPVMATLALAPYHDGPKVHFVSNIDGADIADCLKKLDPARTLVIIASKTFTTIETMTNAATAVNWLQGALGYDVSAHLAAVSSATDKTRAFGINDNRVFGFGDYIGGRYSLWGPVGLALMLAIGAERFDEFLDGAAAMDRHFQSAPAKQNLPVMLALAGLWHRNICMYPSRAILPYDQRLSRLPAYVQQLDMESNGKSVAMGGHMLERASGPLVWGEPGTNGQHAFYQLLHQGTDVIPVEFLIAANGHEPELAHHHDLLKANCLAQSKALMNGRSHDQALKIAAALGYEGDALGMQAAHRVFPGNRPSLTLTYPKLTPFHLGQIIALYEHRVFVEGAVWGVNSFDQWGVELGKELAVGMLPMITGEGALDNEDSSTRGLLRSLRTDP